LAKGELSERGGREIEEACAERITGVTDVHEEPVRLEGGDEAMRSGLGQSGRLGYRRERAGAGLDRVQHVDRAVEYADARFRRPPLVGRAPVSAVTLVRTPDLPPRLVFDRLRHRCLQQAATVVFTIRN